MKYNGNGTSSPAGPPKPELTHAQIRLTPSEIAGAQVVFQAGESIVLRGVPLRIQRHSVVFELYNPAATPLASENFPNFEITLQEHTIYSGRAVMSSVVDISTKLVCEAALHEAGWRDTPRVNDTTSNGDLAGGYKQFVQGWQKSYAVIPEYKLIVADVHVFLSDLRLWLDRVEAKIRSSSALDQPRQLKEAAQELRAPVIASLNSLFERFEIISQQIPPDKQAAHRAFGQRQLHPHLLCAPFINRTYTKPLGYAGDYEMMNMIVRNGFEGNSLFAMLVNSYLLDQAPAHAVRGRVVFLYYKIASESGRMARMGKQTDIFCVACGPAWEASNFISNHPLADSARFHLLDFNEETLDHTTRKMQDIRKKHNRRTHVKMIKNSVQNLLRAGARSVKKPAEYDMVYCSGLYDYLNDTTCQQLNNHLFDLVRPGGLLVVGNFAPTTPIQNFMGHFLEWFLIYRVGREILALAPESANPENCVIRSEPSGTNFFLEVRKPE